MTSTVKATDIIRNLTTGKLYLVLQIIRGHAIIITSLTDRHALPPTLTLLPREWDKYEKDCNVKETRGKYIPDILML